MSKLKFKISDVRKLMDESDPSKPLMLVGDQGVYLMSTSSPVGQRTIVYAKGCDPTLNEDEWYDNKVAIYGGDDGGDKIGSPADLKRVVDVCSEYLVVKLTATRIAVEQDKATAKVNASVLPEHLKYLVK